MSTFQLPQVSRFEFATPDGVECSLPLIVDLPPKVFKKFQEAGKLATDDPDHLRALVVDAADDDVTAKAIKGMALSQIVTLVNAWGVRTNALVGLGESQAS